MSITNLLERELGKIKGSLICDKLPPKTTVYDCEPVKIDPVGVDFYRCLFIFRKNI